MIAVKNPITAIINPPLIPGPMYEKAGIETKTVSNKNNLFITVHYTTYKIIDNIDIFFCMHNSRPTQSINITIICLVNVTPS